MRWGYSQSSPRKRCRPRRCTAAVSSASPALTPRHSDAVTADAYRSPLKIKCIDLTELSRSDSLKVKRADGCRGAIAGEHQRVPRTVGCPRPRVQVTWAGERAAHGLTQSKSGEKKSNSDEKITTKKKIFREPRHHTQPKAAQFLFVGLSIEACSRYAAPPGPALTPPVCLCRRRRQVCRRMHPHLRSDTHRTTDPQPTARAAQLLPRDPRPQPKGD